MDEQPPICDDGERAVLLSGKWVKLKAEFVASMMIDAYARATVDALDKSGIAYEMDAEPLRHLAKLTDGAVIVSSCSEYDLWSEQAIVSITLGDGRSFMGFANLRRARPH